MMNESLYLQFKSRAEELTVKVRRARTAEQAVELVLEEMRQQGSKRAAAAPLPCLDVKALAVGARAQGIDICLTLDRPGIEQADLGISAFSLGIAGLGSMVQDASGLHTRLVSMLPPRHLALLPTNCLVETLDDALAVIEENYGVTMPPFLSFITGPSKTADIERQLTIGVHGPETLIVLCVDQAGGWLSCR
jgi:L-lactate dehydrogenase complex protein LldG